MTPDEMLKLAENVYEGLSEKDIEEIERIALDRSNFFSKDPNRIHELTDGIDENAIQNEIDFGKSVGKETL